ncbi:putative short chain oxidoreductase/dehydrogenase [Rhexocercosporidium sp. MPI-PUGE-AT-0058]|nr:putative short chain oxidoreductase/dehydrogenase [Rhexocercosporidium sp. MPI-PUGE-AT-0058]
MPPTTPLTWFITGCSSGLGAALAIHALKNGHNVIATARTPSKAASYDEIASLGGRWVALDVTSPDAGSTLNSAIKKYSNIDVLVNNAGYSIIGAIEDISDEEAHDQFETNFFGALRLIRTILPHMRDKKSGTIVNITSIAGIDGQPTCGLYAASKFALEGLSESLQRETAAFGIRTLLVEPGAFRTQFLTSGSKKSPAKTMTAAYAGTPVDITLKKFDDMDGKQRGDAKKAVSVIFDVVTKSGVAEGLDQKWLRLPLASDCVMRYETKLEGMRGNLEAVREFVGDLDLDGDE